MSTTPHVTGTSAQRDRIVQLTAVGTVLFVISATIAWQWPGQGDLAATVIALSLFGIGFAAFTAAFLRSVNRSRTETLSVAGIWFLAGSAPRSIKVPLLSLTAVQVIVALGFASARPFTAAAFGILVPMFGLGMTGLWGATHGRFATRREDPRG